MIIFKFNESSMELSKNNEITGLLYLEIDDKLFFPEAQWNDFIIIVLCWWLNEVEIIKFSNKVSSTFYFMDGPASFKLYGEGDIISFKTEKYLKEVEKKQFIYELKTFASSILLFCENKNWYTKEIEELKTILKRLDH